MLILRCFVSETSTFPNIIGSPHILQVSGIGEANKLKNLGINIVHESKCRLEKLKMRVYQFHLNI